MGNWFSSNKESSKESSRETVVVSGQANVNLDTHDQVQYSLLALMGFLVLVILGALLACRWAHFRKKQNQRFEALEVELRELKGVVGQR